MIKLLLINPYIPEYRVPIYNLLNQYFDLTVAHSGKLLEEKNISFKQIILPIRKVGPFSFFLKNLHRYCNRFNVVISEGNIRYLDRNILILNPFRKYKWICWGIGVSASYNNEFDKNRRFDFIRHFIFKFSDAQLFYSNYPIKKYLNFGFKQKELFVANNTTEVYFSKDLHFTKKSFLFIGSLYRQKKIFELLNSYKNYFTTVQNPLPFHIIGDGEEKDSIKEWIIINNLTSYIKLLGPIYNQYELENHFRSSFVCISPGQAGLSVLTSMGYSTPFITKHNAISGGEIFNIQDGYNGILYKSDSDLTNILIDVHVNREKYVKMGLNAREYYLLNCTPDIMVKGFLDSINYVLSK